MANLSPSRTLALIIAATLVGAFATACTAPTRAQGTRSGNTQASADAPERPEYKIGYQLTWQGFPRISSRKGPRFLDVLGNALVVQDHNNNLTVVETDTGRNRWSVVAGKRLDNFVGNVRAKNRLLVSSDTTVVVFNIETGELLDFQRLDFLANTRPVVIEGLAIYGCTSGEILSHNFATGYKQWAYRLRGTIIAEPVHLGGFDVAAVSDAGDVVILDAQNATARGRLKSVFDGIDNNPVADEFALYLASRDQSIYAFARDNGARLWRYRTETPITAQPTLHDGILYVHLPREGMIAIDTRSGERMWANTEVTGRIIAMRNGRLLAWDGRAFTTLDPTRGETIERVPFPDVHLITFDAFEDGAMYTISRKGLAQKFNPSF